MTTQTFTDTLVAVTCGECHLIYGMTQSYYDARKRDHANFYCPNGHCRHFVGQTTEDRLRTQLRLTEQSEAFYRDQAASARRSAAAQKGQRTRVLNLITRGICPVPGCRRNFDNVRQHMADQHPDFHEHEDRKS